MKPQERVEGSGGKAPLWVGLGAGALWGHWHMVLERARGGPAVALGEWDVLLPAMAIAAGEEVPATVAAIHGGDLGAALLSTALAQPMSWGLSPLLTARVGVLVFGGATVGALAAAAAKLAPDGRRVAVGVITALCLCFAWPGLHWEWAGLSGRTPEAASLVIVAGALLLCTSSAAARLLAGLCSGIALLFSPVVLGSVVGAFAFVRTWRHLAQYAAGVLAGPLLAFTLPGALDAVRLYVQSVRGDGGRLEQGGAGLVALLRAVPGALQGGAHGDGLVLRDNILAVLGGVAVAAWLMELARLRRDKDIGDGGRLALALVPAVLTLGVLPQDTWFYPLAYRYWIVPLGFALALACARVHAWPHQAAKAGAAVLVALSVTAAVPPGKQILAPVPSLREGLWNAGAHRLGPRPGLARDAAASILVPWAPPEGRRALLEGFGASLGADLAVDHRDGAPPALPDGAWWPQLSGADRTALLFGIGCGWTALPSVPPGALDALAIWPGEDREVVLRGLACCGTDPARHQGSDVGALEARIAAAGGSEAQAWAEGRLCWQEGHMEAPGPPEVAHPGMLVPPRG